MKYDVDLLSVFENINNDKNQNIAELDVNKYLKLVKDINLPLAEKLRQFAIYLEHNYIDDSAYEVWQKIKTFYNAASEQEPNNTTVLLSFGISATFYAEIENNPILQKEIFADGKKSLIKAIEMNPNDSNILYALGLNEYMNSNGDIDQALIWFQKAVTIDTNNYMAQLYVGHCHFDKKQWKNALEAFLKIDKEKLSLEWPRWRLHKLNELIAYCCAKIGQIETAIQVCSELLAIYESYNKDNWQEELIYPDELVDIISTELKAFLYTRLCKCLKKLDILDLYFKNN